MAATLRHRVIQLIATVVKAGTRCADGARCSLYREQGENIQTGSSSIGGYSDWFWGESGQGPIELHSLPRIKERGRRENAVCRVLEEDRPYCFIPVSTRTGTTEHHPGATARGAQTIEIDA